MKKKRKEAPKLVSGSFGKVYFDEEKLRFVFRELANRMRKGIFPYNLRRAELPERKYIPPETLMPRGSRNHFLFLFHACNYMRRMDSNIAFQALSRVFVKRPEIFLPESFCFSPSKDTNKKERWLREILQKEKPLKANISDAVKFWVYNSEKLFTFYESNPENIFSRMQKYNFWEAKKIIENNQKNMKKNHHHGFLGFQLKMTAMLIYFFCEAKLISPMIFPPPLDIHILRFLLITEIFQIIGMKEPAKENGEIIVTYLRDKTKESIARALCEFIKKEKIDPVEFAAALWLFGRTMCSSSPVNSTMKGAGTGRKTQLFFKEYHRWKVSEIRLFHNICMQCPFSGFCNGKIPGQGYGIKGGFCMHVANKQKVAEQLPMRSLF